MLTIEEKTRICALAADSRKANGILVLDVGSVSSIADRFLICSGSSDRQVQAIADAIRDELTKQDEKPLAVEGYHQGKWILIDCADLILHVFDDKTREFYDLEHLWHQAAKIEVASLLPATTAGG
jgi:ribosome-associated protein